MTMLTSIRPLEDLPGLTPDLEREALNAAAARAEALAASGKNPAAERVMEKIIGGQKYLVDLQELLKKEIEAHPSQAVELYRQIAAVAQARGDLPEAEKALHRILNALPEDWDALKRLGLVHMGQGNLEEAERIYRLLLQKAEKSSDKKNLAAIWGDLGLILKRQRRYAEALNAHETSLSIERENENLMGIANQLGNIVSMYILLDKNDEAEKLLLQLMHIEVNFLRRPDSIAKCASSYGTICLRRGKIREALDNFEDALQFNLMIKDAQGIAICFQNMGEVELNYGNCIKAIKLFRKSLEIYERMNAKNQIEKIKKLLTEAKTKDAQQFAKNVLPKYADLMQKLAES
jgi:tetratricopeptide (TPR) repeat protein